MKIQPTIIETVKLPSKGLLYKGIPDSFSIRPMTVNEVKMLYGSSNTLQALNKIIQSVIVDVPDFPVEDMVSADKLYLAYMIRSITFTPEYKSRPYCPYCKTQVDVSIDLMNDIEVEYLPDDFQNPRNIGKLPVSGDEIEIRLLTSSDFERIINRANEIRKKFPEYEGEPTYPVTMAMQIYSVNGKRLGSRDMEEYVLDMSAMDDLYINKKVAELSFGPKMPVEVECPHCGTTLNVSVNIAEDFFRPSMDF